MKQPVFNFIREPAVPRTAEEFEHLKELEPETLRELGLSLWSEDFGGSGTDLWLFPEAWYDHIPEGYMCRGVFGAAMLFNPGVSSKGVLMDKDVRSLTFGILIPHCYNLTKKTR